MKQLAEKYADREQAQDGFDLESIAVREHHDIKKKRPDSTVVLTLVIMGLIIAGLAIGSMNTLTGFFVLNGEEQSIALEQIFSNENLSLNISNITSLRISGAALSENVRIEYVTEEETFIVYESDKNKPTLQQKNNLITGLVTSDLSVDDIVEDPLQQLQEDEEEPMPADSPSSQFSESEAVVDTQETVLETNIQQPNDGEEGTVPAVTSSPSFLSEEETSIQQPNEVVEEPVPAGTSTTLISSEEEIKVPSADNETTSTGNSEVVFEERDGEDNQTLNITTSDDNATALVNDSFDSGENLSEHVSESFNETVNISVVPDTNLSVNISINDTAVNHSSTITENESEDNAPITINVTEQNVTEINETELLVDISFTRVCVESCEMEPHQGYLRISGTARIDTVFYTTFTPPSDIILPEGNLSRPVDDFIVELGDRILIDGNDYFDNPNGNLLYDITSTGLPTLVLDNLIFVNASEFGNFSAQLYAVGEELYRSNEFVISVRAREFLNISLNHTLNVSTNVSVNFSTNFTVLQLPAKIGEPVQWIVHIPQSENEKELVSLPSYASNIMVKDEKNKVKSVKEIFDKEKDLPQQAQSEKKEKSPELFIELNETNSTTHTISYETPAPLAFEKTLAKNKKEIVLSSEIHYSNVEATSILSAEVPKEAISIMWIEENIPIEILEYLDENNNGLIDKVRWIAPHLSNQTFVITIEVLNVQSYPMVGSTWEVRFVTVGTAHLSISAFNGTSYGENNSNDLTPVRLSCGNETIEFNLTGNTVTLPNYHCDNTTSYWTVQVHTSGRHDQEFLFGNATAYARNTAFNYSSGLVKAFESISVGELSSPYTGTEALSADYVAINKSDNSRWAIDITPVENDGEFMNKIFVWNITSLGTPSFINVSWEGYGDSDDQYTTLKIWNFTSESWVTLKEKIFSGGTDQVLSGAITTRLTDYINSTTNEVVMYIHSPFWVNAINTDYVELAVTGTNPIMVSSQINPLNPSLSDNLAGYCNATDADGGNVTYYYRWFKDGSVQSSGNNYDDTLCAQETATVANSCGGSDTGVYGCSGVFASGHGCALAYDGTWSTYAVPDLEEMIRIQINYTVPDFATSNTKWQIKRSSTGNVSIPANCLSQDTLRLKITLNEFNTEYFAYCHNGATWTTLASAADFLVYEEKIFWDIDPLGSPENEEYNINTVSSASTAGSEQWILSCLANDGTTNSSWMNSSAVTINSAPVVESVSILPTTPILSSDLVGYCNASDAEGSDVSYYYKWFKDGSENESGLKTASNTWSYQEDANETTCSGNFCDGDYSTYEYFSYIYFNYTKPSNVIGALFQLKDDVFMPFCLDKRSLIDTPDGKKLISEIDVGDEIISYNIETKTFEQDKVTGVKFRKLSNGTTEASRTMYSINNLINATGNHLFIVNNFSVVETEDLKIGDFIHLTDHNTAPITSINVINTNDEYVYELSVQQNDNYFANGILSHNSGGVPENYSIPAGCLTLDEIRFRTTTLSGPARLAFLCYNSTNWEIVKTIGSTPFDEVFYEEGIWWNLSGSQPQNTEIEIATLSSSFTSGSEEWILSCLANDGTSNSTWTNSTARTVLAPPVRTLFNSTNFAVIDYSSAPSPWISAQNHFNITWHGNVNAGNQDLDSNITYGDGWVSVNSRRLDESFNSSANITFFAQTYETTPLIMQNNIVCPDCWPLSYTEGAIKFNVSHFTNYSTTINSNLTIWDQNDTIGGGADIFVKKPITFTANYSNRSNNKPIVGAGVFCNISFNNSPTTFYNMSYNAPSKLYQFNTSFTNNGNYETTVFCNGSSQNREPTSTTDTFFLPTNSFGCGATISSSVTLVDDIGVCTATGLNVGANGITIDCNGYTISGNNASGSYYGISLSGDTGVTVENCNIKYFNRGVLAGGSNTIRFNNITANDNDGILVQSASNNISFNNIFKNDVYGIYINSNGHDNIIYRNNVYDQVTTNAGIYLIQTVHRNLITHNNVYNNAGEGIAIGRWALATGYNNTASYNTVHDNGQRGIFVFANKTEVTYNTLYDNALTQLFVYDTASAHAWFVNISRNMIHNSTTEGLGMNGARNITVEFNDIHNAANETLRLTAVYNSTFRYNNFTNGTTSGLYADAPSMSGIISNTFIGNQFLYGGHFGLRMYGNTHHNTFINNIWANNSKQVSYPEIQIGESTTAHHNTFINNTIHTKKIGIRFSIGNNNKFINTIIKNFGTQNSIQSYSYSNELINVTFNGTFGQDSTTSLWYKWFVDANVKYKNTTGLINTNITIYNASNDIQYTVLTDSQGDIPRTNLTEYYIKNTTKTYQNYTITVSKAGYDSVSTDFDLTTNKFFSTELNALPISQESEILPSSAYSDDKLLGYCNVTDADSDVLDYFWKWYLNGAVNETGRNRKTITTLDTTQDAYNSPDTFHTSHRLTAAFDSKWSTYAAVSVSPANANISINYSIPVNTISALWKSKFGIPGYVAYPKLYCRYADKSWNLIATPDYNFNLNNFTTTILDDCLTGSNLELLVFLDGHTGETTPYLFEEEITWTTVSGYTEGVKKNIINRSLSQTIPGDTWILSCLGSDLTSNSSWMNSSSVSIANYPPNTPSPILSSLGKYNYTNETLKCSASILDLDGHKLNVTVGWYRNNTLMQTIAYNNSYTSGSTYNWNLLPSNTTATDFWNCSVRLNDGLGWTTWGYSSNLTIQKKYDTNTCTPSAGKGLLITDQFSCKDMTIEVPYLNVSSNAKFNVTNITLITDTIEVQTGSVLKINESQNTIWVNNGWTISGFTNISNTVVRMNGTSNGQSFINVTPSGSLLIEKGSNITNGIASSAYYYIRANAGSSVNITDSFISNGGYSDSFPGVHILTTDAIIDNNIFDNNYYGVFLNNADNSEILTNNFTYSRKIPIYSLSSDYVNVSNNHVYEVATAGCSASLCPGIKVTGSLYNTVMDNTVGPVVARGVSFTTTSAHGIIKENTIRSMTENGIDIDTTASNTSVVNNIITDAPAGAGIKFNGVDRSLASGNTITNTLIGIQNRFNAQHNRFIGNTLIDTDTGIDFGYTVTGSDYNLTVQDTNITGDTTAINLNSGAYNIYFINTTFNNSAISFTSCTGANVCNLTVKYYMDVYVNYSNSTPVKGANISAQSDVNSLVFTNQTTASNGYISKQTLTSYTLNHSQAKYTNGTNSTPYTVNMSFTSLNEQSKSVSFTGNTLVNFEIQLLVPPVVASSSISPTLPKTNDTLTCTFNITGGSDLSTNVTWFNQDGVIKKTNLIETLSHQNTQATLNWNYTKHDDSITCSVNANNTAGWSGWSNSSSISILNHSTILILDNQSDNPATNVDTRFYANYSSPYFKEIGDLLFSDESFENNVADVEFYRCNNDNKMCLVAGALSGGSTELRFFNSSGVLLNGISTLNSVDIGAFDFDGDGLDEVIVGGDQLRVFNHTGTLLWNKATGYHDIVLFGDVNDDGKMDIIVGLSSAESIYVYNSSGTELWSYTNTSFNQMRGLTYGDFSNNGKIVYGIRNYEAGALNSSGNPIRTILASGGIGDVEAVQLDTDPELEILVGEQLQAYDNNYVSMWNITSFTDSVRYDISVADIDNDGEFEIIVGDRGAIKAFRINSASPSTVPAALWTYSTAQVTNYEHGMAIMSFDFNDDHELETTFGGDISTSLILLNSSGDILKSFPFSDGIGTARWSSPGGKHPGMDYGDFNGDGIYDVAVASRSNATFVYQEVSCIISFNDSNTYNMTWNSTLNTWQINRSFSSTGTYEYTTTCTKGGYETQVATSPLYITENTPNTPTVSMNSTLETNTSSEDLWCWASISDDDADPLNVSVQWFRNNSLVRRDNFNNSYASGSMFSTNLLYQNTSVNDFWNCSVKANDGMNWGDWGYSNNLTVVAATPFISIWNTSKTGGTGSNSTALVLPLYNGGSYNFVVNWGDGTSSHITTYNQAEVTHNYKTAGLYQINISGSITGWSFNNGGDRQKIMKITQWGDLRLGNGPSNGGGYFYGASNLNITATDVLDLTGTTTMYNAFRSASTLVTVPSMNDWDMSQVTNMQYGFSYATNFNQNISKWNTSKVTNMFGLFLYATNFNQSIGNWDTKNVQTMRGMFQSATYFNQPIGNWNTSKVTIMNTMFNEARNFNQPIGNWNTSKVTNMNWMFSQARKFNQPIGNWNTSKVTDMSYMFYFAFEFNQTLENWDTKNVQNMYSMFGTASNFNQNISKWNTKNVTNMNTMFHDATKFNQDIGAWDTGKVANMYRMFEGASSFDQNLSAWNITGVTDAASNGFREMFDEITLSTANYDALLIGWESLPGLQNDMIFSAGNSKYCLGENAKTNLETTYTWTITDGGKDPSCVPDTPVVSINSTDGSNQSDQDLNCLATLNDNNGEPINATVRWFKNAVFNKRIDYNNSYSSGYNFAAALLDTNTTRGDNWSCRIKINDGSVYSGEGLSVNLTILNTPPPLPTHIYPTTDITNRYPNFNWTTSLDNDGDAVTYDFNLTAPGACTDFTDADLTQSNRTSAVELCTEWDYASGQFEYTVKACDPYSCTSWTTPTKFNVTTMNNITLTVDDVNFGTLNPLASDDTTDGSPAPFTIQNDGNVRINVSFNASDALFDNAPLDSSNFQYKARSSEASAFTEGESEMSFINVVSGKTQLIAGLLYLASQDEAYVDFSVTVPAAEVPGAKKSTLVIQSNIRSPS